MRTTSTGGAEADPTAGSPHPTSTWLPFDTAGTIVPITRFCLTNGLLRAIPRKGHNARGRSRCFFHYFFLDIYRKSEVRDTDAVFFSEIYKALVFLKSS